MEIRLVVVDDHQLFREGLVGIIEGLNGPYRIVQQARNGKELLEHLESGIETDLVIMDYSMPVMDGLSTLNALQDNYPGLKVLMLSMRDDDLTLIRLIRAGACGFLNKDINPKELHEALLSVYHNGYYYTGQTTHKMVDVIRSDQPIDPIAALTEQELKFIELACSEDTYYLIADKMHLSAKTIDGYRASVFEKLDVKSRVGLALYAVKHNLYQH